jgi:hypothetical protein
VTSRPSLDQSTGTPWQCRFARFSSSVACSGRLRRNVCATTASVTRSAATTSLIEYDTTGCGAISRNAR